jgi:hypothetical protein
MKNVYIYIYISKYSKDKEDKMRKKYKERMNIY